MFDPVVHVFFLFLTSSLLIQVRLGGEMLYDVLTDPAIERCAGIAIACNKSDLKTVKPDRVRAAITKELEQLRNTRGTVGEWAWLITRAVWHLALSMWLLIPPCHSFSAVQTQQVYRITV
jgi:methylthioribose-1-phosphate isomerase